MLCLRQDVCDDPTLVLHEEFRQKFRVTYRVFDRIVDALKGSGLVQDPRVPKPGPPPIPAESKVLHILRMLAVGAQYDAFEEGSLCDRTIHGPTRYQQAWLFVLQGSNSSLLKSIL